MSPGKMDVAIVRRHLLALDRALSTLGPHRAKPLAGLAQDTEELWAVERGLQLCAQNALDIATHIAAGAGRDSPDYASAIDVLADLRVLPREFARRFRAVAGFRNVLVHGYLDIDVARVHEALNSGVDELIEFARHIEAYLRRE